MPAPSAEWPGHGGGRPSCRRLSTPRRRSPSPVVSSGLRRALGSCTQEPEVPYAIATLHTALCDDKTDAPLVVTRTQLLAYARCVSGRCIRATHVACQLQIM